MSTSYTEDEYLMLSGIQHFAFCRRQWALIHIEGQWAENLRTVQGDLLHQRCHDGDIAEKRGNLLTVRALPIHSARLGISGSCDVVEFNRTNDGVPLVGREGLWRPFPVEYKRGEPKENKADMLQMCAQAICLEEMLCCEIPSGAIYYGETHRRLLVDLDDELRTMVVELCDEMHSYAKRGHTPTVKTGKLCNACSLRDICMPKLMKKQSGIEYLNNTCRDGGVEV